MTDQQFDHLAEELKKGNSQALDVVFRAHFAYCVDWLVKKYRLDRPDAEDLFMDAMLIFRREMLRGKISNTNLRGYLIRVAGNEFLQRQRKKQNAPLVSVDSIEYQLGMEAGLYDDDFNPLLKAELLEATETTEQQRVKAFQQAWATLGEQCRKLLRRFYLEKAKLKDLQEEMGYSTYDTIKSIRRRCFNQLRSAACQVIDEL